MRGFEVGATEPGEDEYEQWFAALPTPSDGEIVRWFGAVAYSPDDPGWRWPPRV